MAPRPDSAPWYDWFAGWLIGGGCAAALLVDWILHASGGRVRIGTAAHTVSLRRWLGGVAALVTVSLVCCCGVIVVVLEENDGALRFAARDGEVLPRPPSLRLVSVDHCADGGSSGNCTAEFVVIAVDGGRTVTVARLVEHLRDHGWPLVLGESAYTGCRDVGGILHWTSHCLWLYADADPGRDPPSPRDAVVVYIDNAG